MESPSGKLAPSLETGVAYLSKLHSRRSSIFQGAEGKLRPTGKKVYNTMRSAPAL